MSRRFFSTNAEVVSDLVQTGDTIKAMDGHEYVVTSVHPAPGMALARREDKDREPHMLVLWMIHNADRGTE
jgi:hypothetical protein